MNHQPYLLPLDGGGWEGVKRLSEQVISPSPDSSHQGRGKVLLPLDGGGLRRV
jgi:hypothetical protein